jgi:hypothetical protein
MERKAHYIKLTADCYKINWFVRWYWIPTEEEKINGLYRQNTRKFKTEEQAKAFRGQLVTG